MNNRLSTDRDMDGFLVRWTKEDARRDIPARLRDALKASGRGRDRAPLIRELLVSWIEDIEKHGELHIKRAVEATNEQLRKAKRK